VLDSALARRQSRRSTSRHARLTMADSGNAGTVMDTDRTKSERLAAVPVPAREVVPNSETPGAGLALCYSASRPHPFNFENAAAIAPPVGAEAGARFGFPASILCPPVCRGGLSRGCSSQSLKLVFNGINLSLYSGTRAQLACTMVSVQGVASQDLLYLDRILF